MTAMGEKILQKCLDKTFGRLYHAFRDRKFQELLTALLRREVIRIGWGFAPRVLPTGGKIQPGEKVKKSVSLVPVASHTKYARNYC